MKKILFVLFVTLNTGCSTISYYSQSIHGQLSLLSKREDIQDVIKSPKTSEAVKTRLKQAISIRKYASKQLKLPDNKSYTTYADLGRPYVVWNVFAAPEFSLKPKSWCYLIVGCVSYRGYFDEEDAIEKATELKKQHYDVYVAGITAYSTLGWFDDPILNTMINWNERALASLIFHELSHQLIYIPNETDFDEAFASAVERMGTIQWLLSINRPITHYLNFLNAQQDFRGLLLTTRDRLATVYQEKIPDASKRKEKQKVLTEMKKDYESIKSHWPSHMNFDKWFAKPINNARLTSTMTYLRLIPAFYQMFVESGADWNRFYQNVRKLKDLTPEERKKFIESKLAKNTSIQTVADLLKPS